MPGFRLYVVHNEVGRRSAFKYVTPSKVGLIRESAGWHLKLFWITDRQPWFWHAVKAKAVRCSIGFKLEDYDSPESAFEIVKKLGLPL